MRDRHTQTTPRPYVNGVLGVSDQTMLVGPYAVTLTRLAPDLRLPRHAHERATLNVVLDGQYGEKVDRGHFQSHGPATLIVKPAGAVHENVVGASAVECLVVDMPTVNARTVQVRRSASVARVGGRLRIELVRRAGDASLVIEELVVMLLSEAASAARHQSHDSGSWLESARELLHDEPGPQSLSDLGRRMGRHPIFVARAFRARFGCSVGEYVRCLRLERARRLLHDERVTLADAAVRAGFSDQSHMTRDFQREFRMSPGTYRRHIRQVP